LARQQEDYLACRSLAKAIPEGGRPLGEHGLSYSNSENVSQLNKKPESGITKNMPY